LDLQASRGEKAEAAWRKGLGEHDLGAHEKVIRQNFPQVYLYLDLSQVCPYRSSFEIKVLKNLLIQAT
jgi:hypothetical protein